MSKKPFRFSLIKRQPDEPTIVLASDFNSRPIPWNEIIEVIEVHYDKLEELTAKVKRYEEVIEAALRLQDLWLYTGKITVEHASEAQALNLMKRNFEAALNQGES